MKNPPSAGGADDPEDRVVALTGRRCSLCKRPALVRYRPFCSRRCADLDLGRWLTGDYRVPTDEESNDDGSDP